MGNRRGRGIGLALALCVTLTGCGGGLAGETQTGEKDLDQYLSLVVEDPATTDPQCTSEYYTVPLNVFDRLVEVRGNQDGTSEIVPSLADAWEISPDGLEYTFHLHPGITFSNGSPLTASDVAYTLDRVLTHPDSHNRDVAMAIRGAEERRDGRADTLEGVRVLGELDVSITLDHPYAAFLACLSTPGASILDAETTQEAGDRFGIEPEWTVGTGPFLFAQWKKGVELVLEANPDCWSGAPRCQGLRLLNVADTEAQRLMFERGELDILDLDNLGSDAEYLIHGDIYQDSLRCGPRVGISYIALNQRVKPLDDVRVRKALQLSLDRELLLDAVFSGRGQVENGILPHGLIGFQEELPAIPYDPDRARALLAEAGLADGFDLRFALSDEAAQSTRDLAGLIVSMWRKVGVRAFLVEMEDGDLLAARKRGELACYTSTWSADFNDPDNFMYTFFGSRENTDSRSLCYPEEAVMARVRRARSMVDQAERLREYQSLERRIVQEDGAWIPLFSKIHYFAVSRRVDGFQVAWNGWSSNNYRNVAVLERDGRRP